MSRVLLFLCFAFYAALSKPLWCASLSIDDSNALAKDYEIIGKEAFYERRANRDQYLAREHARVTFETTKQWVSQNSDLNKDIEACSSSSPAFPPEFSAAHKALEICDGVAANINTRTEFWHPKIRCEFLEFSPCRIELIKRAEFRLPGYFDRELHPDVNSKRVDVQVHGSVVYLCEPIAVLGVFPKWICGAGHYAFATYRDNEEKLTYSDDEYPGLIPFYDFYTHEFSKAASIKETMKALKLLNLPD